MDDRHSFRRNLRLTFGFTAVLWIVWFADVLFDLHLAQYGIIPHTAIGLRGILFSPFIHDTTGISHILSNTLPFMVLFFVLISAYQEVALFVLVCIHLLSGLLVWMYAPPYTVHIGISGIIYGIAAFLVGSGFFRRDLTSIGIAVFVSILYGGMAEGLIRQPGISWQSHVFGAAIGFLMSFILRSYHQRPSPLEEHEPDDDRHFFEKHPGP
ncbi:MAG: rhomboid family intramembrane serine protease [Bacteroidetes bacterium]|nr:rhomboid family intramembrane serine protease [Bacteroidota bacterium]